MIIHNDPNFSILFGDLRTKFDKTAYGAVKNVKELLAFEPFCCVKKNLHIEQLVFLNQVHGADGLSIHSLEQLDHVKPFAFEGDFIVTHMQMVGIALATADCLPIILYDSFSHMVGIVHAGWRGAVQEIAKIALERMVQEYGANVATIRVFFGPCAKPCCYQVGQLLLDAMEQFSYGSEALYKMGEAYHFDLPLFNRLQLQECGVAKSAFNLGYNQCTMCDTSFCSKRRDGSLVERQMTVVALR